MNALLSNLRRIVRHINNVFISLLLIVFYFSAVGLSALLLKLSTKVKSSKSKVPSYWENVERKRLDADYFRSPY